MRIHHGIRRAHASEFRSHSPCALSSACVVNKFLQILACAYREQHQRPNQLGTDWIERPQGCVDRSCCWWLQVSWHRIHGTHGNSRSAGRDATKGHPRAFYDAVAACRLNGVVRAGWCVATANIAAGERMNVVMIAIDGSSNHPDAPLILRCAQSVQSKGQKQGRQQESRQPCFAL